MSLPADSSELNLKLSLVKFHVDNLETTEEIKVLFDAGIEAVDGWTKWIVVNVETIDPYASDLPAAVWTVFCCTQEDPEGIEGARLKDTVMKYLVDPAKANGIKAVPLYDTTVSPWTEIGHLMIDRVDPGPNFKGIDQTKVSPLTVRARWANTI